MPTLGAWFAGARSAEVTPNPEAMSLATVDEAGMPSVRIVLCKGMDVEGGSVVFFTNYNSVKGRALEATGRAAVCFHWDALNLQARIEGLVVRTTRDESDVYFQSRRLISRVGAWASWQSEALDSNDTLMERAMEVAMRFGLTLDDLDGAGDVEIPRPEHWGGFRLWARRVELWVGGDGRLHDRARWERALESEIEVGVPPERGAWSATRLNP